MNIDYVPVKLPSKCLTYQNVDPSNIRIRPFKGRDEQLVAELDLRNSKRHLLELVRGIIQGVDPEQITTGDLSFILVWEAINSYTNLYPVRLTCQGCLQDVDVKVDLSNLEKKELPDSFKQPYPKKLSKQEVKLRLLTLKDDIEVFNFGLSGQSTYLYTYALGIVDENTSVMDRVKILEEMSPRDIGAIRKFYREFEHGPDFNSSYVCPKCSWEGRVLVPFRLEELILSMSES